MDAIKVQEILVWDRHSGKLIGYADIGDVNTKYVTLRKSYEIATYMLAFPLRSIFNPLKFSLEKFATSAVTGPQLFVFGLESSYYMWKKQILKVLAVT